MHEEKIKQLISELDSLIPKEGAKLYLHQYGGGPDESEMKGNRAGYLRFGIEVMKGGFIEAKTEDGPNQIRLNLDSVIADGSDVGFDYFERSETLSEVIPKETLRQKLFFYVVVGILISILIFALMGFIWTIKMFGSLLFS